MSFPAPPPPFPSSEAPLDLPNGDRSIAFCIVGELRTFAMPVAHMTIAEVVRVWRAHAFIAYHTRFNPDNMCLPSKQGVSCAENDTAFALLRPKKVRYLYFPECTSPPGSGYSQLHGTDVCFRDAERHARREGFQYRYFVRVRPDFAFAEVPPVPTLAWHDNHTYSHGRHSDFAFLMTREGLRWFRYHGLRLLPRGGRCNGTGYLDRDLHPLSAARRHWSTASGLVRRPFHFAMVDGATPRVRLRLRELQEPRNAALWHCNVTSRSRKRCLTGDRRRRARRQRPSLWALDMTAYRAGLERPPERLFRKGRPSFGVDLEPLSRAGPLAGRPGNPTTLVGVAGSGNRGGP